MKHVDLSTGKIYGCEKNTFSWWHEKGHIEFNNSDKGSSLILLQSYVLYFWMLIVSVGLYFRIASLNFLSLVLLVPYFGVSLYEELWCNAYARKQLNSRK